MALGVIAITFVSMAGLAVLAARLKWDGFWIHAGQPFATVIAGMAALGAGGLAFYNGERQRLAESVQWRDEQRRETEKDINARFIAAAGQLADDHPSTRSFGVYVLAGIADDWYALGNQTEYQVCIDVLTGYLLNPNPDYVDPTLTTAASAGGDGTVRATIVRALARRAAEDDDATRAPLRYAVRGADLRAVRLDGANLACADLREADLSGAMLRSTDLQKANLQGANLSGVDLRGSKLQKANLEMSKLSDTILYGAHLTEANLGGSERTLFAEFFGIRIGKGTKLQNVHLDKVDLRGLDLQQVQEFVNIDLTGSLFNEDTKWPAGFTPPVQDLPKESAV
ncbi:hypothetical protein A5673_10445 [Mycobacterium sp. E3198]|nr:hypothetical protein A5673_10445 [Mycobacterium sp. E3198]